MNLKKLALILFIVGTALLAPTILLAIYVDSAISTVLLVLSILCNAAALNIVVLSAQHRQREKARRKSAEKNGR